MTYYRARVCDHVSPMIGQKLFEEISPLIHRDSSWFCVCWLPLDLVRVSACLLVNCFAWLITWLYQRACVSFRGIFQLVAGALEHGGQWEPSDPGDMLKTTRPVNQSKSRKQRWWSEGRSLPRVDQVTLLLVTHRILHAYRYCSHLKQSGSNLLPQLLDKFCEIVPLALVSLAHVLACTNYTSVFIRLTQAPLIKSWLLQRYNF